MTYRDKLTGDLSKDFALFVGSDPAPQTSPDVLKSTVAFFTANFGGDECDPEEEDAVVEFCQMVPAGAYGSPDHSDSVRIHYPDYTDEMDNAINDSWETISG